METVLVTGVTGRVGANLAVALQRIGYGVRGVVMPGDPQTAKIERLEIDTVQCDLRDTDAVLRACQGVDTIIHLAAAMGKYPGMTDRDYFDVNVTGTWNMVYAASQSAPNLQRFVFASTDAVYSAQQVQYLPMDEQHPRQPFAPYGMVKLLGEDVVNHFHRQVAMPTVICRFGTIMAGDQILNLFTAEHAIINLKQAQHPLSNLYVQGVEQPWKLIEEAVDDPHTLLIPRNKERKPWIHNPTDVRDTIQGILLAMEKDAAIGETFNILAAEGTSWEEGALYVHEKTGRPYEDIRLPVYWAFYSDISKARKLLGYAPQYDYRRMIDDALAFQAGIDIGVMPA